MKFSAVIWDLDGTLLDTSEGVLRSVSYTVKAISGPHLSSGQMEQFIGPPIKQSLMRFCGLDEKTAIRAVKVFRDRYSTVDLLRARVYPGVFSVLRALQRTGVKIGVATYKRADYALRLLQETGIAAYCHSVKGADFDNKKTKQDILVECLNELGVHDLSQAVLIGDSEYDASGAAQANVSFLAVTYGYGFKTVEDVMAFPHIGVVDTAIRLLDFLSE